MTRKAFVFLFSIVFIMAGIGCSKKPYPEVKRPVNDYTGTLSEKQITALEAKILSHESKSSDQIAIVMISKLGDQTIEQLSMQIAEKWKGGQKGKDNGLLILLVKDDRQIRIETGYGFEGRLPDGLCGRIIRDEIAPFFKKEKFYEGIDNGLDKIFLAVKGEYTGEGSASSREAQKNLLILLFLLALVVTFYLSSIHRLLGAICGGTSGFFIGTYASGMVWGILLAIIGFFIGLVAKEIFKYVGECGNCSIDRAHSHGSARVSGGVANVLVGAVFKGGGGRFGGGGASGSW